MDREVAGTFDFIEYFIYITGKTSCWHVRLAVTVLTGLSKNFL